jgi:undecaprenyl-diphosphatase
LGDSGFWVAIGAGLLIWGTPALRRTTWLMTLAAVVALIVAAGFKYAIRRRRPQERRGFYIVRYDRYSFPSGHATRMGAIAVVVSHFYPKLGPASYVLALFVAACRVLVGVHYPSDVICGLLIGFASGAGVLFAVV